MVIQLPLLLLTGDLYLLVPIGLGRRRAEKMEFNFLSRVSHVPVKSVEVLVGVFLGRTPVGCPAQLGMLTSSREANHPMQRVHFGMSFLGLRSISLCLE